MQEDEANKSRLDEEIAKINKQIADLENLLADTTHPYHSKKVAKKTLGRLKLQKWIFNAARFIFQGGKSTEEAKTTIEGISKEVRSNKDRLLRSLGLFFVIWVAANVVLWILKAKWFLRFIAFVGAAYVAVKNYMKIEEEPDTDYFFKEEGSNQDSKY